MKLSPQFYDIGLGCMELLPPSEGQKMRRMDMSSDHLMHRSQVAGAGIYFLMALVAGAIGVGGAIATFGGL